jgi:hypothetical protein
MFFIKKNEHDLTMKRWLFHIGMLVVLCVGCESKKENAILWDSEAYSIYGDRVIQKDFIALAKSSKELKSNYKSQSNTFKTPKIDFKFAINRWDNEQRHGYDHRIVCLEDTCNVFVTFGKLFLDSTKVPPYTYLKPNTKLRMQVDMRAVLKEFAEQGYYKTFNEYRIYAKDFDGVFVAGSSYPLRWYFGVGMPELKDDDGDGIYETVLTLNAGDEIYPDITDWKPTRSFENFPAYSSPYPILDAIYNLSLDELMIAMQPDSTYQTGKDWYGIWTRDVSYSVLLSLATLQPEVAKKTMLQKVQFNRIMQDIGTGGGYPIATDGVVWALAAWEIYKITGDKLWLRESFKVIKNTLKDDLINIYDSKTGLIKGECSFLDWPDHTYPPWMEPANIFETFSLSTNALYYQANRVLASMAALQEVKETAIKHGALADQMKDAINKNFWLEKEGYYAQYLYGRENKIKSKRHDALGHALCVLFDIATPEQQRAIIQNSPTMDFGIPVMYPQLPRVPPLHNNAIWPFLQAFWSRASAKVQNEKALAASLSATFRPAALFLTSKENFVADSGDFAGTQMNSDVMLWTIAGQLTSYYQVLFGMSFEEEGISFSPCVPKSYDGPHRLKNFKYRNAVLDITLEGYGHTIKRITLDGEKLASPKIPASLQGNHEIKIVLSDDESPEKYSLKKPYVGIEMPHVRVNQQTLVWQKVIGAETYQVFANQRLVMTTRDTTFHPTEYLKAEYQIIAIDKQGYESLPSQPIAISKNEHFIIEAEKIASKSHLIYPGFSGDGFVRSTLVQNDRLHFPVSIPSEGLYAIDFRYSNGNGPINSESKCAIRSLWVGDTLQGTVVLPQRGLHEWYNWGFTNRIYVTLPKGLSQMTLSYEANNQNTHSIINEAMIDYLRIQKVEDF